MFGVRCLLPVTWSSAASLLLMLVMLRGSVSLPLFRTNDLTPVSPRGLDLGNSHSYDPDHGVTSADEDEALTRTLGRLISEETLDEALQMPDFKLNPRFVLEILRMTKPGKRLNIDPNLNYVGIGKKDGPSMDSGILYAGIGKRNNAASRVVKTNGVDYGMLYSGIGKRENLDSGILYAGLGKRGTFKSQADDPWLDQKIRRGNGKEKVSAISDNRNADSMLGTQEHSNHGSWYPGLITEELLNTRDMFPSGDNVRDLIAQTLYYNKNRNALEFNYGNRKRHNLEMNPENRKRERLVLYPEISKRENLRLYPENDKRNRIDSGILYAGVGKRDQLDSGLLYAGIGKRHDLDIGMLSAGIGKRRR